MSLEHELRRGAANGKIRRSGFDDRVLSKIRGGRNRPGRRSAHRAGARASLPIAASLMLAFGATYYVQQQQQRRARGSTCTRSRRRATSCWRCRSRARRFRRHRPRFRRLPDMNPRTTINCCLLLLALLHPGAAAAQGARTAARPSQSARGKVEGNRRCHRRCHHAATRRRAFSRGKGADNAKAAAADPGHHRHLCEELSSSTRQTPIPTADIEVDPQTGARGQGWSRIVGVRGKRELTEIYFWKERDTNGGLVVIAAKPNELTVVNIVGRVDLASLGGAGADDSKAAGRDAKALNHDSYLIAISNTRGHSLPVTKIRFFWASKAMPLSTASAAQLRRRRSRAAL